MNSLETRSNNGLLSIKGLLRLTLGISAFIVGAEIGANFVEDVVLGTSLAVGTILAFDKLTEGSA